METLSAAAVRWTLTEGRPHLAAVMTAKGGDELQRSESLRRAGLTLEHTRAVLDIAAGTAAARATGQPRHTWWSRVGAEQASDPHVARWRARRFDGLILADLTAGCGGDAIALSEVGLAVAAVEHDPVRIELLRHNLPSSTLVVDGDVMDGAVRPAAWWADPARRVDGRRVKRLRDGVPSLPALVERFGAEASGIAVSPGIALDDPDLPSAVELEFVQVGQRLVEATVWLGSLRSRGPGGGGEGLASRSATLLPAGIHVRGDAVADLLPVGEVGAYLLEPAAALVRARLHEVLGERIGARRIAAQRAMLTADAPTDSPWFTSWAVEAVLPAHVRTVRRHLRQVNDDLPLEVALHGIDVDVQHWLRGVGAPRGPHGRHLHVLRVGDGGIAVLTRRVPGPPSGAR